jgi:hypothetical protein
MLASQDGLCSMELFDWLVLACLSDLRCYSLFYFVLLCSALVWSALVVWLLGGLVVWLVS